MEENNQDTNQELIQDNNEEVIKETKKGSYITGAIGAIIGGLIASLPWVLVYVYGNMIVALLAIFIALGAFQGYKICKGKMGKGLPAIIAIISVAIIILLTTVICPAVMLANEGIDVSIEKVQQLYEYEEVSAAIMQDTLVSLAFTIIGIAGTIKSISKQIKSGVQDVKFSEQPLLIEFQKNLKEKSEVIKKAFETLGAINQENAAVKDEIINELEMTHDMKRQEAKQYFQLLIKNNVIKKVKGKKYYYDVENAENNLNYASPYKETKKTTIITIVIVLIVVFVTIIALAIADSEPEGEKVAIPNTNLELNVTSDLVIYDTAEEIATIFGTYYASYYNFVVLDQNNEAEIYGGVTYKSDMEVEYTLQALMEVYKAYADTNYMEVSEIQSRKIGDYEFKYYTYNYGEDTVYLGNLFIAETDDAFIYLDCYADLGNQAKIDEVLKTLFK